MTRAIVEVRGGAVIAITADQAAEVLVIDTDAGEEDLWEIEPDTPCVKATEKT